MLLKARGWSLRVASRAMACKVLRTAPGHAPWRRPSRQPRPATRALSGGTVARTVRVEHNRFFDRRETDFVLFELEQIQDSQSDCAAVLDSVESFITQFSHLDPILDQNPPRLVPAGPDNTVVTPAETKQLLKAYKERGFVELDALGLPFAVQCAAAFSLGGAFSSNPLGVFTLTRCAADLLEAHGCDELKQFYLPKLRSADWFGTMALSESQAGSSLADICTMATPVDEHEGAAPEYRIRGEKMWTSGAFHDLSDNIIHMLLARTPNSPPGAGGISLFLVPNVLKDGTRNDVELISLNRKMGHKALSNCAWSLGQATGGAVGYLVGEKNRGVQCMFGMMNAMRIEVGLSAAALGKRGLQESLVYAAQRQQGGGQIINYPDVKRMLLLQKAFSEGAFALCVRAACLHDRARGGDTNASALLDLLTEIVKSWPAEWCLEANKNAIQVLGGAGYVQDFAVEQLYRDNRLNMIHEGTAGIHALTLLGRKVQAGKAQALFDAMLSSVEAAEEEAAETLYPHHSAKLAECAGDLRAAVQRVASVTDALTKAGVNKQETLVNAHDYMTLMGHTVIAWTWLRIATAAVQGLDREYTVAAPSEQEQEQASAAQRFYEGKLHTCVFFFRHQLPQTRALAELLVSFDSCVADMQPDWF